MALKLEDDQSSSKTTLASLARHLAIRDTELAHIRQIADRLFKELKKKSKFVIQKTEIGGSVAKGTAIRTDHDVDCVIYLNSEKPPFAKVLKDFEDIISSSSNLAATRVNRHSHLVQAVINGMQFDIVPAAYFSEDIELQRRSTVDRIQGLRKPSGDSRWSSSLEGSRVEFAKRQSPFVHDVVRLAKYWNKTVTLNAFATDGKRHIHQFTSWNAYASLYVIECIATHCSRNEERLNRHNPSVDRAFEDFLENVNDMGFLSIYVDEYYARSDVERIRHSKPMVLDPCNPYGNVALGLSKAPKVMEAFQRYADMTLTRLARLLDSDENPDSLEFVFEPKPIVAPRSLFYSSGLPLNPKSWLVEVKTRDELHWTPNVIIRNENVFNPIGKQLLQSYLCNNIKILNGNYATEEQLAQQVWDIISLSICGHPLQSHVDCTSIARTHQGWDLTLGILTGKYIINVSLNWTPVKRNLTGTTPIYNYHDEIIGYM